ncbi:thioesterase family protein [Garciella nitratireducens]|uniref:Thioesterase superfamily n=1 Tax=Garciella nitratireducens DSM 15102 TaxID=1121911 RepID=A0A1T4L650_9FIRM|nr:thioesterase family protein [Garciella nitratireducens]RBP38479.1 thioesterase superfamily protein [Garciella nitratireducens]SJZ50073.1 Thioesterase superfamily [Garciella nitratireducens DSM 15102]
MDFNLKEGLKAKAEMTVTDKDTALSFGSGEVKVFATPVMIGLMENASLKAVDKLLPQGHATVGTYLEVRHLSATPVGMKVTAQAELVKIEGRTLIFQVEVYDEVEKIGEGIHHRFIVPLENFIEKCNDKLKK